MPARRGKPRHVTRRLLRWVPPSVADITITIVGGDAAASGDTLAVTLSLVVDAATAPADGGDVTPRLGEFATITAADATASGDPVTPTYDCTVTITTAAATASGDPVSFAGNDATIGVSAAAATASGDTITIGLGATVAVTGGNATADGDPVVLLNGTTVTVTSASATASGDDVAVRTPITVTVTGGNATASSGVVGVDIVLVIGGGGVGGGAGVGSGTDTLPSIGLLPGRRAAPGFFRIKLTSLHYPERTTSPVGAARPAVTLARLEQFTDAQVEIPINDARTAKVTIGMNDPTCLHVHPYQTLLHMVYVTPTTAHLVFWGPIVQAEWASEAETVTLSAVDASVRMQHHFIRYGDQILNKADDDTLPNRRGSGKLPIDYEGLRWLRDAALNTDEQTARGVPNLGIADGTTDTAMLPDFTALFMLVERGQNCWELATSLAAHETAPDFQLRPVDNVAGIYAYLDTFVRQGNPDPTRILLQDGFGLDNSRIDYTPGGKIVTHAHLLSTDKHTRVTVADSDSSEDNGIYVDWIDSGYDAHDPAPLVERGKQIISAYGTPPDYFRVQLNQDAPLYYMDHFAIGDACKAQIHRGQLVKSTDGELSKVTLAQVDTAGNVVPQLEAIVVADGAGSEGDTV